MRDSEDFYCLSIIPKSIKQEPLRCSFCTLNGPLLGVLHTSEVAQVYFTYAGHILLNLYPTEFDGVKEHKVTPVLEVEMFK